MREQNSSASTSIQERQTDAAHLDLLKHDIPESWYPSPKAQKLVGVLEADVDREKGDAIDHAYRSLKILSTFCKTLDPERRRAMADAMLLHDIPGRTFHRETDDRAKLSDRVQEGWKEYIAQLEDSDKSVIDYMHDQVVIGTEARDYREAIKHQSNGISAHDKEQIMNSSYEGMVNVAGWRMGMPEIRGTALEKLAGEVNIESLVIKAAEMMDNLKNPPKQDSQQLRNILEAESFYCPFLEAIGYDAMAAEMASTCNIYRLRGQGREDIIDKAVETYRTNAEKDPAELAMQMFGLSEKPEVSWIVNETSDEVYSGVNCRFAELMIPIAGALRRVLFRQKSIGSTAKKMSVKGEGYDIMDAFAFLVICDAGDDTFDRNHHYEMRDEEIAEIHATQTEDLAKVFSSFVDTITANGSLLLRSGDGVSQPIYVQGDSTYVNPVHGALSSANKAVVNQELREEEIPYRVSRASALVGPEGLPVEVQIITDLDRKLARTDVTSHAVYKNNGNDSLRWLQKLHKRVEHMKYGEGNPISRAMGAQALRAVWRGIYPESFAPEDLYNKNVR